MKKLQCKKCGSRVNMLYIDDGQGNVHRGYYCTGEMQYIDQQQVRLLI